MPPIMTKYLWVPLELNVIAIPSRVRLNTKIYQPHNTHRFDLMHNITGLKIFRWCAIRITRRDFYIVALSVIMGTSSSKCYFLNPFYIRKSFLGIVKTTALFRPKISTLQHRPLCFRPDIWKKTKSLEISSSELSCSYAYWIHLEKNIW